MQNMYLFEECTILSFCFFCNTPRDATIVTQKSLRQAIRYTIYERDFGF